MLSSKFLEVRTRHKRSNKALLTQQRPNKVQLKLLKQEVFKPENLPMDPSVKLIAKKSNASKDALKVKRNSSIIRNIINPSNASQAVKTKIQESKMSKTRQDK